jgi:hypothetical protein
MKSWLGSVSYRLSLHLRLSKYLLLLCDVLESLVDLLQLLPNYKLQN